jgi:high-affinity iron transporter
VPIQGNVGARAGLEAALIVEIFAGFLKRQWPPGALRSMWFGVGGAIAICVLVGVARRVLADRVNALAEPLSQVSVKLA